MSLISTILNSYSSYREQALHDRFFKCRDLEKLIESKKNGFEVALAGSSVEQRPIYLLRKGTGEIKVFLWSQMHGDEATGTMALFDLFNFLDHDDEFNLVREKLLKRCRFYFAPMINPDGAQRFTRRNAQGIDINRDFLHQQTPEGRLLRQLRDEIQPHFGFNLHDQAVFWSAGSTGNPATISLLAPAYDKELSVNEVRERAMQVIVGINKDVQTFIPNHVGLFDDEYEPRAFGDNFQAAGTSTILIEAGGYTNDLEKQFIRKVYFAAILSGLIQIADSSYSETSLAEYYRIPQNEKRHYSILIKNCLLKTSGLQYRADIGLIAHEQVADDGVTRLYEYRVEDMGDLSGRYGYEEVDASGYQVLLTQPLELEKAADFILQDGVNTILCFENGRISNKTSNFIA